MSSINILFFSNNCEPSKYLISLFQNEKIIQFFHLVCTDNNPKIPTQITRTPTIIIRGIPTPYVAGDAFAWFAKIKQWKINLMMQKMSLAQQQYLQNINNNLTGDNEQILGFSEAEMSGMSDIFSFFSKNIQQECQDAFPKSYFSCENLGKERILTLHTENDKIRIDEKKHKTLHNKLEIERKKKDKAFKENIENFKKQYNKS